MKAHNELSKSNFKVYEETGYDISKLIQPNDFIDGVINYQYTRLYIVKKVPMATVFIPRTRKEIKCCEWFNLEHLPTHKTDTVSKSNLGINPNSFFMIMPFVKRLKKWLSDERQKDEVFLSTSQTQLKPNKKANNNGVHGCSTGNSNKKRQRHKSMGDLDGANSSATVSVNVLTNTPKCLPATTNNKKDKPKANTKRQLFTAASVTESVTVEKTQTNGGTQTQPVIKLFGKQSPSIVGHKTKKKTVVSVIDSLNSDPNIKKWKHFTFNVDSIINVL